MQKSDRQMISSQTLSITSLSSGWNHETWNQFSDAFQPSTLQMWNKAQNLDDWCESTPWDLVCDNSKKEFGTAHWRTTETFRFFLITDYHMGILRFFNTMKHVHFIFPKEDHKAFVVYFSSFPFSFEIWSQWYMILWKTGIVPNWNCCYHKKYSMVWHWTLFNKKYEKMNQSQQLPYAPRGAVWRGHPHLQAMLLILHNYAACHKTARMM